MGGEGPSSVTNVPPAILPPDYPFRVGLFRDIFPNLVGAQMPNFQQAGGRIGGGPSPTQMAATNMAQQWATSGPQMMGGVQGTLGNLANQQYQPGAADNALQQFLAPSFINPNDPRGPQQATPFDIGGAGGQGLNQSPFVPPGHGQHQPPPGYDIPGGTTKDISNDPRDPGNTDPRPGLDEMFPDPNQNPANFNLGGASDNWVYPQFNTPGFGFLRNNQM